MASHDAQFYFDRASETLSNADPDRTWSYRWDLSSARSDFTRAIRLNPNFIAAYTNRAGIETTRGDTEGAIEDYTAAIRLNPQDPNPFVQRAAIELTRHDFERALGDYDKAIELQPGNRDAYRGRIEIKEMQNDFAGAVMERVHMIEEMSFSFDISNLTNGGFFVRDPSRWNNRLLRQLDRALETDPDFAWGYYYRGVIKSLNSDPKGATVDFQRCKTLPDIMARDYAAIHIWLVQACNGEREKADDGLRVYCQNRTPATSADWQMSIAKYLLNQISERDFCKAIDSADTGRELSEFWYYSGMKHLLTGDKAGASDYFQKSLTARPRSCAVFLSARTELDSLNPAGPTE